MSDNLLISRKSLKAEAENKIADGKMKSMKMVDFSKPVLGAGYASMSQEQKFAAINAMTDVSMISSNFRSTLEVSGKYGSGFDIPVKWSDGQMMSSRDKIATGAFSASMSSNTLPVDWANIWDAMRIDVTVRKTALPTIRQIIYNITTDPNFTRTINPTEINNFGVVFEENNGHGQAVAQGETMGGGYEAITILIYAAGFTWDLIGQLFDRTITPERVMDAVMVGYNSLKDDLAMSPIIGFSYAGAQQTAASAIGAKRQELLYNTLVDGLDDLGDRLNPITDRTLDVSNVVMLAHPFDARHISQVAGGLPSDNQIAYPSLSEISQVIAYDDEVIRLRDRSVTYSGVTKGTAYMIIPASALDQGYMEIAVKRDLVIEVDEQPDVKTLAQKQEAYYFAEAIWSNGIQYFIQELTLPTW